MNTKNVARRIGSKLQMTLLAALVVMVLFGSLPVRRAHAWSYANWSGRPGAVSVPPVRVGDTVLQTNIGLVRSLRVDSNGRYSFAYRSPATSGDQNVLAQYTIETWSGSGWVLFSKSAVFYGVIKANQSYVAFPALEIVPSSSTPGYYRVTWIFVWSNGTTNLGSTNVVSNLTTDHVCVTTLYRCGAYPGYYQISK